jgi:hypothetical protein
MLKKYRLLPHITIMVLRFKELFVTSGISAEAGSIPAEADLLGCFQKR